LNSSYFRYLRQIKGALTPDVTKSLTEMLPGSLGKTAEVLQDGWYNTGDMASMDVRGFVKLAGRLSRFSKIGGEMVPHLAVEEALQQVVGVDEACLAVTGVASESKGEELVVCYTPPAGKPDALLEKMRGLDIPNLWLPRRENFIEVQDLPLLGSGKLDLSAIGIIAGQLQKA
jgi:acyl-[acyl-carrier-protein]-phospholipid O-acyltransferase/long-chain-fatty-acid--[acyl-carrier-protein] ligase